MILDSIIQKFKDHGQGHVFSFYEHLNKQEKESLLLQCSKIDLKEVSLIVKKIPDANLKNQVVLNEEIIPVNSISSDNLSKFKINKLQILELGKTTIEQNRVFVVTAAGGQGTRLNYEKPKGTYPITPILNKSLFQVFSEKVLSACKKFKCSIPWFIMTSEKNHEDTINFFEDNNYFNLPKEDIGFFKQGTLPTITKKGKIFMKSKSQIDFSPSGHGGLLKSIYDSGIIKNMKSNNRDILSYFQIDNPLINCVDPLFIGLHLYKNSEVSSKSVEKKSENEKAGIFCEKEESPFVVEYINMPKDMAKKVDDLGEFYFKEINIASHLFNIDFIISLNEKSINNKLPLNLSLKKIKDSDSNTIICYKLERFIFDSIKFAKNSIVLKTNRKEEFSPVKNKDGKNSPHTCKKDQIRKFASWFKSAGIDIKTDDTNLPSIKIEISPLFASTKEEFLKKYKDYSKDNKLDLTKDIVIN